MVRFALVFVALLLAPVFARGQACGAGSACVADKDLEDLLVLAQEQKCRNENLPQVELDQLTITTDKEGRVYYSGANPRPFKVRLTWCNYKVEATAPLDVMVAKDVPPVWGWRFRAKFAGSYLFLDAFERKKADAGVELGFLWEFLYWRDLNFNVATGFRSVGLAVGLDITNNFGFFAGYAFSFWTMRSNPQLGLYFGF